MAIQNQLTSFPNPSEVIYNEIVCLRAEQKELKDLISSFFPTKEEKDRTRIQAAEEIQISLKTLNTLLRTGQLEYYNIGRSVRIPKAAIDKFKENQKS